MLPVQYLRPELRRSKLNMHLIRKQRQEFSKKSRVTSPRWILHSNPLRSSKAARMLYAPGKNTGRTGNCLCTGPIGCKAVICTDFQLLFLLTGKGSAHSCAQTLSLFSFSCQPRNILSIDVYTQIFAKILFDIDKLCLVLLKMFDKCSKLSIL